MFIPYIRGQQGCKVEAKGGVDIQKTKLAILSSFFDRKVQSSFRLRLVRFFNARPNIGESLGVGAVNLSKKKKRSLGFIAMVR